MTAYKFTKPRRPQEFNEAQILKAIAKSGGVYVSPKADGVRLQIIFSEDANTVVIRSREDKPFRGLALYEETLNAPHLLDYRVDLAGWTVEAEGIAIDSTGTELVCAETSGTLQRKEPLRLSQLAIRVFDLHHPVKTKGQDIAQRFQNGYQLAQVYDLLKRVAYNVWPLSPVKVDSLADAFVAYDSYRQAGFEGAVLTPIGAAYASGKKVASGWKIKPEETKEATVTGLIEAVEQEASIPKAMIGSLEVTYEDGTKGKVGAGRMTHAERYHYWRNPQDILGRLIEVSSMETNETGGQRHPVFKMFRDTVEDKGVKI